MAEYQLKNIYNEAFLKDFCIQIKQVHSKFDCKNFTKSVLSDGWSDLELKQRMRRITETLHEYLPKKFEKSASILCQLVDKLLETYPPEGNGLSFEYMFLPDFIEIYGQDHLDISIKSIERITQFTSAEFGIRPFIHHHPKKMIKQMQQWAKHKNKWVRRLATEGCRPRLPWAMALIDLKKDPQPILPILEKLKNDPAETVRRSVANNINDISKDHPELVLTIAKKWIGKSKETDWVVKHALRTLLKKGNTTAMTLFGFADPKDIYISNLIMQPAKIKIGSDGEFSFQLKLNSKKETKIRLEFSIYF